MSSSLSRALLLAWSVFIIAGRDAAAESAQGIRPVAGGTAASVTGDAKVIDAFRRLPLRFEANRGQTDRRVKFLSRNRGYTLFLTDLEAVVALDEPNAILRLAWLDANADPVADGVDELAGRSNYLIGNDPDKWQRNVPLFGKVRYREMYPGVDLVYYGQGSLLEYDLVAVPGANIDRIRFAIRGAQRVQLDRSGDLIVDIGGERIRLRRPIAYQPPAADDADVGSGARTPVSARYVVERNNEVRFVVGSHDRTRPLVIDPQLVYSSYLGGMGNDGSQKVAIDSAGYVSIVGWTRSVDFPVVGPLQGANGGTTNAFIAKFDPSASGAASLIYSTYLGGTGIAVGRAIGVDAAGDVFVVGDTNSPNFPVTLGAYQTTCKFSGSSCSTDIFAARLDSTGSVLQYSTYIGGTGIDRGFNLAVDSAGRMVITGPSGSSNFPVTTGAYQPVYAGGAAEFGDATVTLLNPAGGGAADLVYATYLGGSGQEQAWGIVVDAAGAIYVSGSTTSANFPTTVSAFSTTYAGSGVNALGDAFVSKLQPNGLGVNDLVYSTFLGGASDDRAEDIAIDSQSQIYVTGFTMSSGFPVTAASAYDTTFGGGTCYSAPCADAFIVKIDSSVSGQASLLYSTFLGGSGFDLGHALALDPNGFVHISGETTSSGFPLVDPIQSTCTGGCPSPLVDAFVSTFDLSQAGASGLVFSTFLGGSDVDTPWGMAADANGNLYVTGQVFSTNFPMVTPYQSACRNCVTFNSSNRSGDGFLFKLCTTSCPGGSIDPSSLTFVVASVGSVGGTASSQRVTLSNSGNSSLTIVGIDITGTNAGDFSQTNTCPASLDPQTSCFIDVSFTAGGAGPRSATLTITPNAAPLSVSLTGIVAPQVTVTSPNTGVSWTVGEARSITFNHNLGTGQAVTIDVSRDGGNTWSPITSYTTTAATTGTYSWTVTAPTTTQARIRVTWAADSSVTDLSDVNFTLTNLSVTVTSPNSNVKWRVAETRAIKFNHNLGVGQRLNIDVSRDGGGTWSPITVFTTTSATSGTYNWLVTGPATTRALIRVTAVSDPTITDTSNVTFTILARVTVTAPNTSLTWGAGSIRTVKWTHNLGTSQTVNIDFSANGGASWAPLAVGVPNATSTTGSWTGPTPSTVTTQARIRISQATNPSEFDVSDVNFTLAAPFVFVKYPNSNVLWTTGSSSTITWNHNLGALEHVNVELSRDGGATWQTIGANVGLSSTSGSFAWVVSGPATTAARVRVSWSTNPTVRDESNVNFRIQ